MSSNLPFTQPPADPQLKDVLDQQQKEIFLSLNCHHLGTIQEFDAENQTASVTINYKKTYFRMNSATGLYGPVLVDYPPLTDCPVIVLGGAAGALTFPIAKGDECLVLFNDRDLDNWFQGSSGGGVATTRLHSFADAIVLVGIRSLGKVLTNYDEARAVLKNGTAMVGVGSTLVKIANEDFTLKELLQQLIDNVKDLVTATAAITVAPGSFTTGGGGPVTGVSGAPTNASDINAAATALTATAGDIAELLE